MTECKCKPGLDWRGERLHDETNCPALLEEIEEYHYLFDLHHKRTVEATQLWRQAHPGNELVSPDTGKMLEWLLGEMTRLREALENFRGLRHQLEHDGLRHWIRLDPDSWDEAQERARRALGGEEPTK